MVIISKELIYANPPSVVPVTITGTGDATACYVEISGQKYATTASVEVSAGDTISFVVAAIENSGMVMFGIVNLNGTKVFQAESVTPETYSWKIPDEVTAVTINLSFYANSNWTIDITTT